MKTSVKERDTSRLLSRTRGVIWIAAFFVCLYPHQEQGPAQWSGSLLFARQVSNSTTAKCDLKSCFDFFPFRVGLRSLKHPQNGALIGRVGGGGGG